MRERFEQPATERERLHRDPLRTDRMSRVVAP